MPCKLFLIFFPIVNAHFNFESVFYPYLMYEQCEREGSILDRYIK